MARKKFTDYEIKLMKEISINLKKIIMLKGITQLELSERTGIASSTISDYVNGRTLMSMGNLQILSDTLKISKSDIFPDLFEQYPRFREIPLIGTICAGNGLLADQNIEEYIHYPFPNKKQPDYALRVKGDSMINIGIEDGDIVYMRHAQWADHNGQLVAALVNDSEEGFLKRIHWSENESQIKLTSENDKYEPRLYVPNQIQICGIYMGHFKIKDI